MEATSEQNGPSMTVLIILLLIAATTAKGAWSEWLSARRARAWASRIAHAGEAVLFGAITAALGSIALLFISPEALRSLTMWATVVVVCVGGLLHLGMALAARVVRFHDYPATVSWRIFLQRVLCRQRRRTKVIVISQITAEVSRMWKGFAEAACDIDDFGVRYIKRFAMKFALVLMFFLMVGVASNRFIGWSAEATGVDNVMTLFGTSMVFAATVPAIITWVILSFVTGGPRVGDSLMQLGNCAGAGTAGGFVAGCVAFYFHNYSSMTIGRSHASMVDVFIDFSVLGAVLGYAVGLFVVLYAVADSAGYRVTGLVVVPMVLGTSAFVTQPFASPRAVLAGLIDNVGFTEMTKPWAKELAAAKAEVLDNYVSDGWYVATVVIVATAVSLYRGRRMYISVTARERRMRDVAD